MRRVRPSRQRLLGAAAFDRAEERRVELLKAAGFNAVRTAHNPPSPAFLDACDRLGMLVMDESFDCWEQGKNRYDYSLFFKEWWQRDMDAMVLRDRNHPCVVMWSIGNEVGERDNAGRRADRQDAGRLRPRAGHHAAVASAAQREHVVRHGPLLRPSSRSAATTTPSDNASRDHRRVPARVIACTESFPNATFDYWRRVAQTPTSSAISCGRPWTTSASPASAVGIIRTA